MLLFDYCHIILSKKYPKSLIKPEGALKAFFIALSIWTPIVKLFHTNAAILFICYSLNLLS